MSNGYGSVNNVRDVFLILKKHYLHHFLETALHHALYKSITYMVSDPFTVGTAISNKCVLYSLIALYLFMLYKNREFPSKKENYKSMAIHMYTITGVEK